MLNLASISEKQTTRNPHWCSPLSFTFRGTLPFIEQGCSAKLSIFPMTSTQTAFIAIVAIFISALIGALVPLAVVPVTPSLTRVGNAFAAGFLTSAAIVHLLPSAHDVMRRAWPGHQFPVDGVATLFGAIIVFLIDFFLRGSSSHHNVNTEETSLPLLSGDKVNDGPVRCCSSQRLHTATSPLHHIPSPRSGLAAVLAATLTFHSLIEGISLGASLSERREFMVLVIAILAHKLFAALALGASLATAVAAAGTQRAFHVAVFTSIIFSCSTPIGAVFGSVIVTTLFHSAALIAALNCASAGVFLYIAFVDLLADEVRDCTTTNKDRILRAILFVSAASAMSVIALWT